MPDDGHAGVAEQDAATALSRNTASCRATSLSGLQSADAILKEAWLDFEMEFTLNLHSFQVTYLASSYAADPCLVTLRELDSFGQIAAMLLVPDDELSCSPLESI